MKQLHITLSMTDSQYEVLETVAKADGQAINAYCGNCILALMETDVDHYFCYQEKLHQELKAKMKGAK